MSQAIAQLWLCYSVLPLDPLVDAIIAVQCTSQHAHCLSLLSDVCVVVQQCSQAQLVRADSRWFPLVQAEAGFRCSAGISSNRMLAKLVSGLHKPDDQTVLLPPDVLAFVAPLPVRALPGEAPVWKQVHGRFQ